MRLYDSHNHLQDERFAGRQETCVAEAEQRGVVRMVVNGSCEADWPRVQALARAHPIVLPSFGYHPWHVKDRTVDWRGNLVSILDQSRGAIGEIAVAVVVTALRVARRCRRIGYLMCHHSPYITALLLCLNLLSHLTSRCRELSKKRRRRWCRKWNRKRERSRSKKGTRDGKRL